MFRFDFGQFLLRGLPPEQNSTTLKWRSTGEFYFGTFGEYSLCTANTVFALGTTLSEEDGFSVGDLAEIYKERWRIEEHYKTAKWLLALDSFNAETERGVLQELYATFLMITATRLMTSVINQEINGDDGAESRGPRKRVNFKSAVAAVFRNLEALALTQADAVAETIAPMVENIASLWQSERPSRSYPRISLKPKSKWSRKGKVSRGRAKARALAAFDWMIRREKSRAGALKREQYKRKKRPKKADANHVPLSQ